MPVPLQAIFFHDFPNSYIGEILDEIWIKRIYEPYVLGKRDQIVVDIGANIGLFSYYASYFSKQIYAVEPAKDHLVALTKMLEFNKIKNVTVCPYALSNKTEKTKLYHLPNRTAYSLNLFTDKEDNEEVGVLSFEDFMLKYKLDKIDLLKLDPEGEEGKIITSSGFAKYAPSIKVIVGEWHNWGNMGQGQFANTLRDLGYEFNWIPNMRDVSVYTAVRI